MRIVFACGGTAGHVNPALAVAQRIKKDNPDAEILFIGTPDKIEATIVPRAGFAFRSVRSDGFKRSFSPKAIIHNIRTAIIAVLALMTSKKILKEFKPDVVVGFGGYVAGPVLRSASKLGIKTAIHEQNAYPGVTNKLLAPLADVVMLTSPEAAKHLKCAHEPVVTGLPVREQITAVDAQQAKKEVSPDGKKIVFSFGGSLGARAINEVMTRVIADNKDDNVRFIHSCGSGGKDMIPKLESMGVKLGEGEKAQVSEYIYDMEKYLAAADVVICRAGASTLAELETVGRASILIPYPYAAENHQFHNARELEQAGAAYLIEEKNLTPEALKEKLDAVLSSDEKRLSMEKAALSLGKADAASAIAKIICGCAGKATDR